MRQLIKLLQLMPDWQKTSSAFFLSLKIKAVFFLHTYDLFNAVIRLPIVNNQKLNMGIGLVQDAKNARFNIRRVVIRRDNHCDKRLFGQIFISCHTHVVRKIMKSRTGSRGLTQDSPDWSIC